MVSRTEALNKLRQRKKRGNFLITNGLEKILAILGIINQAAYHGGNLNGKNAQQQILQEYDSIFLQFQELQEDGQCGKNGIIDVVCWYLNLCTLFDHFSS
jgi:hypothetical protein